MKILPALIVALLTGLSTAPVALAAHDAAIKASADTQSLSEGVVKKVDAAAGKITIAHGPLENLNMPPMTMGFEVKDKAALKGIKAGDKVRFRAEQIGDRLVVTTLKHVH